MKGAIENSGLVFDVASDAERTALAAAAPGGVLPVPTMIYRTDLGKYESWNGTRWAQAAITELGRSATGVGGTLAADPSWSDILIVSGTSMGGQVTIGFKVTLTNANSGAHRSAAIRVTCDGVEVPTSAGAFTAPYISGLHVPVFPSLDVAHTPAAGAHTWKVQGQAGVGDAGAIQVLKGTVVVTEKP
jgi:hypothetical protein